MSLIVASEVRCLQVS